MRGRKPSGELTNRDHVVLALYSSPGRKDKAHPSEVALRLSGKGITHIYTGQVRARLAELKEEELVMWAPEGPRGFWQLTSMGVDVAEAIAARLNDDQLGRYAP